MKNWDKNEKTITVAVVDDDVNICEGMWWLLNNVIGIRCCSAFC